MGGPDDGLYLDVPVFGESYGFKAWFIYWGGEHRPQAEERYAFVFRDGDRDFYLHESELELPQ